MWIKCSTTTNVPSSGCILHTSLTVSLGGKVYIPKILCNVLVYHPYLTACKHTFSVFGRVAKSSWVAKSNSGTGEA